MNLSIREWRIGDKTALAQNLNNPKVLNNLRDSGMGMFLKRYHSGKH